MYATAGMRGRTGEVEAVDECLGAAERRSGTQHELLEELRRAPVDAAVREIGVRRSELLRALDGSADDAVQESRCVGLHDGLDARHVVVDLVGRPWPPGQVRIGPHRLRALG